MRIGIDATTCGGKYPTGPDNYVLNLTSNLLDIDESNKYIIYCRGSVPGKFRDSDNSLVEYRFCPAGRRKVCEQLWLSWQAPQDDLDVLHTPGFSLPLYYNGATVLTVHAFDWRVIPNMHSSWWSQIYFKLGTERTIPKANHLIAISESTKRQIRDRFEIADDKIDVIYHGVNYDRFDSNRSSADYEKFSEKYDIPSRYILFVGAMFSNKNLDNLIHAYNLAKKESKIEDVKLVIAGKKSLQYSNLRELAVDIGVEDDVIFPGYIPDADLPLLYQMATVFVFPSLYEGFGLPVLEAFASGTATVCSNRTSLPEVCGDAGLMFDPGNVEEMAETILRVIDDDELRGELEARGRERARSFTWERTARRTLQVYERSLSD